MSAARHTPGPWFVGAQNDALFILDGRPCVSNDDGPHEDGPNVLVRVFDLPEAGLADANASLIAAAPELLKAARMVLQDMSDRALDIAPDIGQATSMKALADAIAKAEGGVGSGKAEQQVADAFAKVVNDARPGGGARLTAEQLAARCTCGCKVSRHGKSGCAPLPNGNTISVCTCARTRQQAWASKKRQAAHGQMLAKVDAEEKGGAS